MHTGGGERAALQQRVLVALHDEQLVADRILRRDVPSVLGAVGDAADV